MTGIFCTDSMYHTHRHVLITLPPSGWWLSLRTFFYKKMSQIRQSSQYIIWVPKGSVTGNSLRKEDTSPMNIAGYFNHFMI